MTGRLIKAISGFYYVLENGITYECKARGVFRKEGVAPLVGDFVTFTLTDECHGVVDSVQPRRNALCRPSIANIDKLLIVSSYSTPSPNTVLIDRMTALAAYHQIEPVIVFNKTDMGDFKQLEAVYRHAGFRVYTVSALTDEGIAALRDEFKDCTAAVTGNSGVGKSSLLNALFPGFLLETGEVSEKLGRGRHTTRYNQLLPHELNGFVIDTPGFSSLETVSLGLSFKNKLAWCFKDFRPYLNCCRFVGCSHTCESGCAVCEAVAAGHLESSRHASYKTLFEECKAITEWQEKSATKKRSR